MKPDFHAERQFTDDESLMTRRGWVMAQVHAATLAGCAMLRMTQHPADDSWIVVEGWKDKKTDQSVPAEFKQFPRGAL